MTFYAPLGNVGLTSILTGLELTQMFSPLCFRFGPIGHGMLAHVLGSLCRSMKAGRATPTDGSTESTVFADVETLELNDASVRVYDCAGQVFRCCGHMYWTCRLIAFPRAAVASKFTSWVMLV